MLPRRMFLDNMLEDLEKEENMKCDIYEKKGIIHIEMDIPGFDKKDIKVETVSYTHLTLPTTYSV